MANELPLDMIAEIVRLGEPIDWDGNYIFREVLRARAKEGIQAKKVKNKVRWLDEDKYPPLESPENPSVLNPKKWLPSLNTAARSPNTSRPTNIDPSKWKC